MKGGNEAVHDAVRWAVWNAVYWAVWRAFEMSTWRAVGNARNEDPPHPALQDFLREVQ